MITVIDPNNKKIFINRNPELNAGNDISNIKESRAKAREQADIFDSSDIDSVMPNEGIFSRIGNKISDMRSKKVEEEPSLNLEDIPQYKEKDIISSDNLESIIDLEEED